MTSSPRWLDRYQQGQRDRVWHELRQLGAAALEPEQAHEAQLVCDEMAHRARQNVEAIIDRLSTDGYRFHDNTDEQAPVRPHVPPTKNAAAYVAWLDEQFGAVPMTLSSWARIVGDVWLVGTHPAWPSSASADPLVIELEATRYPAGDSPRDYNEERWADAVDDEDEDDAFVLAVAPDRFHKDNVSGGDPYGFVLPDGCVDAVFRWETPMPFVSYLNWVFSEGGFPWPSGDDAQWNVRHRLVPDLLPL